MLYSLTSLDPISTSWNNASWGGKSGIDAAAELVLWVVTFVADPILVTFWLPLLNDELSPVMLDELRSIPSTNNMPPPVPLDELYMLVVLDEFDSEPSKT
jgi:hypothetical protein